MQRNNTTIVFALSKIYNLYRNSNQGFEFKILFGGTQALNKAVYRKINA